jgi:hypothetical protein
MPKHFNTICLIDDCIKPIYGRGWCQMHYSRWYKYRDPLCVKAFKRVSVKPALRFWAKVNKDGPIPTHRPDLGPCWIWLAAKSRQGYGHFYDGMKTTLAHRFIFQFYNPSSFNKTLLVCHACDNPSCCNPTHLWQGTPHDNTLDSHVKGRGRSLKGYRGPRAKFTLEQARKIYTEHRGIRGETARLARKYNVSHCVILHIIRGLYF